MNTGEKINNDKLMKAMADLKANNNPETQNAYVDSLLEAKFLVPAVFDPKPKKDENGNLIPQGKVKVHFRILVNQKKEKIFPCYTDDQTFIDGVQGEEVERVVMTYREIVPLILNSKGEMAGFAINPYTDNMPVTAKLIEQIEAVKKQGMKKQQMEPGSTVRLRTPSYQPVDMINAAKDFLQTCPNVNAAYLQMMEKEDGEDAYLITIDFTGDEQKLFSDLMPIVKNYSFGIPVNLTDTKNFLGAKVIENAEPFYKKESQE